MWICSFIIFFLWRIHPEIHWKCSEVSTSWSPFLLRIINHGKWIHKWDKQGAWRTVKIPSKSLTYCDLLEVYRTVAIVGHHHQRGLHCGALDLQVHRVEGAVEIFGAKSPQVCDNYLHNTVWCETLSWRCYLIFASRADRTSGLNSEKQRHRCCSSVCGGNLTLPCVVLYSLLIRTSWQVGAVLQQCNFFLSLGCTF